MLIVKMHQKIVWRPGPDPLGELQRSPDPLAAIWGLLLRESIVHYESSPTN